MFFTFYLLCLLSAANGASNVVRLPCIQSNSPPPSRLFMQQVATGSGVLCGYAPATTLGGKFRCDDADGPVAGVAAAGSVFPTQGVSFSRWLNCSTYITNNCGYPITPLATTSLVYLRDGLLC